MGVEVELAGCCIVWLTSAGIRFIEEDKVGCLLVDGFTSVICLLRGEPGGDLGIEVPEKLLV